MDINSLGKNEVKRGINIDLSLGKVIVVTLLFLFVFALPARLYDIYSSNEPQNQGEVAGISTSQSDTSLGTNNPNDIADYKFNIVTVAGIVTISSSILLLGFYFYEQYQKQKFASPEL
ncbi:hypothetical protein GF362_07495 [Candidatus Dojkabacteria bacterium]|nr:hypothetical protein [Candidatus Dojkabacteria bacterium]